MRWLAALLLVLFVGDVGTALSLPEPEAGEGGVIAEELFDYSQSPGWAASSDFFSYDSKSGGGTATYGVDGDRAWITRPDGSSLVNIWREQSGSQGKPNIVVPSGPWNIYAEFEVTARGGLLLHAEYTDSGNYDPWVYAAARAYYSISGDLVVQADYIAYVGGDYAYDSNQIVNLGTAPAFNTEISLRFEIDGQTLRLRAWETATTEPETWQIDYTIVDANDYQTTYLATPDLLGAQVSLQVAGTGYLNNYRISGAGGEVIEEWSVAHGLGA